MPKGKRMPEAVQAHIDVTAEDIARGCSRSHSNCPVALAVQRALPGAVSVSVLYKHAHIRLKSAGEYLTAILPESASQFIEDFDTDSGKAAPLGFDLTFNPRRA